MKKLIILLTLLAVSCTASTVEVGHDIPDGFRVINFEGHRYLSRHQGGIIHLESCTCKK